LLEALETMPELFTKFGGHRQAAGVTLSSEHLETFRERFRAHAALLLTSADFEPALEADAEIAFREINDQAVAEVLSLAPFGFGNPSPVFIARGIEVIAAPDIRKEKHVFVRLKGDGKMIRAKAWNFAGRVEELAAGSFIDIAFQFEDDAYSAARGYAPWQVTIKDVRASSFTAAR